MFNSIISRICLSGCILIGFSTVGGCGSEPTGKSEASTTGTLSLPLVTQVGEHTYRLVASLDVYGPVYTSLYTGEDASSVLTTTLPTGNYTAYLTRWSLERLGDDGIYQAVSANLTSGYYQNFPIYNQSTTSISFQFETDGVIVVIGSGQLKINIDVKERAPACTILGDDCPQDSWCAPPGLTGMPLQCVPAGYAVLGSACAAPTDCQANATCLDFGTGPTCTALCAVANAGQHCNDTSICTKVATDYGLCIPEGASIPDAGAGGSTSTGGSSSYGGWSAGGSTYYGAGGKKPY